MLDSPSLFRIEFFEIGDRHRHYGGGVVHGIIFIVCPTFFLKRCSASVGASAVFAEGEQKSSYPSP
jgi:hypothetical protein